MRSLQDDCRVCNAPAARACVFDARSRGAPPQPISPFCRALESIAAICSPSSAAPPDNQRRPRKCLGVADRPTDVTDMAFVGLFIVIARLIGSLVFKVAARRSPCDCGRGAHRRHHRRMACARCGRSLSLPTPTVWFMNSVGLNIFIAIVGISAGPASSTV